MSFVYLDTQILVWGIKKEATPGQEEMIAKAEDFLEWIDKSSIQVAIPSVVFGELLLRVPEEKHGEVWAEIGERNFIVHPYDALAAVTAARVWLAGHDLGTIAEIQSDPNKSRAALRADCQIIGIAVSRRGACIYSNDADLAKLAQGFIDVRPLPEPSPKQLSIPTPIN